MSMDRGMKHSVAKALVEKMLEHPENYSWSLQGLGMLRATFNAEFRLNIWNQRFSWCGSSRQHTHPWDFDSLIIAGRVCQRRYVQSQTEGDPYVMRPIYCGTGSKAGHNAGPDEGVRLVEGPLEIYEEGSVYHQHADEIHDSFPLDGTVTMIRRKYPACRLDHVARIYRPAHIPFQDAVARPPTDQEVQEIVSHSLNEWFVS